ncbi:MAG TPA: hypothetical protein VHU85_07265 [Acidimicrobiales bacterium]|nr:hypothetical protein [Acidimicrobiales bacterium]
MAPPASSAARRPAVRPQPAPRRAPLRLFEAAPRSRPRSRRRPTVLVAVVLIVGSLLSVVVADDLVAQGQIRLSHTQSLTAAALTQQKQLQVAVAQLSAPQIVVTEARQLGMVAPTQIVDLPSVPLNVALPVPNTAPAASTTTSTSHTP